MPRGEHGRFGAFLVNGAATDDGATVLGADGPIKVGEGGVSIGADGTVRAGNEVVGQLMVAEFADPGQLTRENGGALLSANTQTPIPGEKKR